MRLILAAIMSFSLASIAKPSAAQTDDLGRRQRWEQYLKEARDAEGKKDWEAAKKKLSQALNEAENGFIDQPGGVWKSDFDKTYRQLHGLYAQSQLDLAEQVSRRALQTTKLVLPESDPAVIDKLDAVAQDCLAQGKCAEAIPLLQASLEGKDRQLAQPGTESTETLKSVNSLIAVYDHTGEYDKMAPLLQRKLAYHEKTFGKESDETCVTLLGLAEVYGQTGDFGKGEAVLSRYLTIKEKATEAWDVSLNKKRNFLAWLLAKQGKNEEAEKVLRKFLAALEDHWGKESPALLDTLFSLGAVLDSQKKLAEAEDALKRCVALVEQKPEPKRDLAIYALFGRVLRKLNKSEEAGKAEARAKEIILELQKREAPGAR